MFAIIGILTVIGSVVVGYAMVNGHFAVLLQINEFLIIGGSALGAFFISNGSASVGYLKQIPIIFRGPKYGQKHFLEALTMMYVFFRVAKAKGDMALEAHVEKPTESSIFRQFPTVMKDHVAFDFLCGYMRLLTLGTNNAIDIEGVMDNELDGITHECNAPGTAINGIADGAPALGIVAAVLGVIHTMGSISEPPDVLGHLIGCALVGTFFGVGLAYGFVGPIAACITNYRQCEIEYVKLFKAALLGHMQGYAPQVSVEFARKALPPHVRPSFAKLDEACNSVTIPQG